jgi:hypothetical protein
MTAATEKPLAGCWFAKKTANDPPPNNSFKANAFRAPPECLQRVDSVEKVGPPKRSDHWLVKTLFLHAAT